MFSGQFTEKWVSVRERNIKLLLETATYIATTETVTCIITTEYTTCMIATETPTCIVSIKIVTHIFAAETFTCINAAETSNCIIATETVTCIIATKRSTNINVAESTTNIIAIEPQKLHNCNRHWHLLHNCYKVSVAVPTETTICRIDYRNFHLQKWYQSQTLLVIIKKFSELVRTKSRQNSFSITCIT